MHKFTLLFTIATFMLVAQAEYYSNYGDHGELLDETPHNEFSADDFHQHHHLKEDEERKDYNYDYTVHDPKEDKYHQHQESSKDGVVRGYYSVKEADGSLREVHYTADKEHGFKAIVVKNGEQVHPHTGASNHQDPGWD